VLTIEELLVRIRRIRYGKQARVLHIPIAPLVPLLGAAEKVLLSVLPVTAGQLASFANDGVAEKHPRVERYRASMKTPSQVLALVAADEG
jgi:hypothetical protein